MWSLGCILFELLTGEYCFDPEQEGDEGIPRDESHLQLMMEMLGPIPKAMLDEGRHTGELFNPDDNTLRHTKVLGHWGIELLLHKRYDLSREDAKVATSVLENLLCFDPRKRWSAQDLLECKWLSGEQHSLSSSSSAAASSSSSSAAAAAAAAASAAEAPDHDHKRHHQQHPHPPHLDHPNTNTNPNTNPNPNPPRRHDTPTPAHVHGESKQQQQQQRVHQHVQSSPAR
eukprot:CAMPEP_0167777410 /NCGR_PEP_ID=MMETSP0111_2-20121227/3681_1 /TAXON_ID=91324 /ORGANISM="Lotharella globosa, Strain CCCM811" /LENGTH=228 /DNA_ID=CAMNT_0007667597 /DNA_START=316 /DNA_END=1002 /DNA_ORIENTATION=+